MGSDRMEESIKLKPITTSIEIEGADEVIKKLEKIKSLMCEISDLSKQVFK